MRSRRGLRSPPLAGGTYIDGCLTGRVPRIRLAFGDDRQNTSHDGRPRAPAALFWDDHDDAERAELERCNEQIEADAARLEYDRADLERRRPVTGSIE